MIVKLLRKPKSREILARYTDRQLILDVKTRWTSLYDMLEVFLKNLQAIRKALIDLDASDLIEGLNTDLRQDLCKSLVCLKIASAKLSSVETGLLKADKIKSFVLDHPMKPNSPVSLEDLFRR